MAEKPDTPNNDAQTDAQVDADVENVREDAPEDSLPDEPTNPNREAAKYRTRLREVESERDALELRIESLQRSIINDMVDRNGYKPDMFWAGGTDVADLLHDDGTVDATAVAKVAKDIALRFGVESERERALYNPYAGRPVSSAGPPASWREILNPHG